MSESKLARWTLAVSLSVALGVGAAPAFAQDEPEQDAGSSRFETIEEITVTARKREESLEDTPISVVAFSSEDLEATSSKDLTDLSEMVANLDLATSNSGTRNNATIFIRGIGQDDIALTNDMGVGAYIDGVYLARMQGSVSRLADVERIEVLRGPQGTLFGRNTTGGAVNIITKKPQDELDARVQVTVGNYGRLDSQAMLNIPLIGERLFARFNIATADTDGYTKNKITEEQRQTALGIIEHGLGVIPPGFEIQTAGRMDDENFTGGRASLLWLPSEDMEFRLTGEVTKADQKNRLSECVPNYSPLAMASNFRKLPGSLEACEEDFANDEFENALDTPTYDDVDIWTANLHFNWDLGWGELRSITSRREMEWARANETDNTWLVGIPNFEDSNHEAFSQELQLTGNLMDNKLQYVSGLYWYEEEGNQYSPSNIWGLEAALPFQPSFVASDRTAKALTYAAYGQFTYNVNERLSFTAGIRRSHDSKEFRSAHLMTPDVLRITDHFGRAVGAVIGDYFSGSISPAIRAKLDGTAAFIAQGQGVDLASLTPGSPAWNGIYGGAAAAVVQDDLDPDPAVFTNYLHRVMVPGVDTARLESEMITLNDNMRTGRWGGWTPMANLAYQFNDDVMAYLTWSKGFRSGGYNGRPSISNPLVNLLPFKPEKVSSWEAGMKGTFLDRRLSVNLAVFNMDYTDMQMTNFRTVPDPATGRPEFFSVVSNAGEATIKGFELEVAAIPFSGLRLQAGFGLTDAEFDEFLADLNSDGNVTENSHLDMRRAPKYTYNLSAEYAFPLPAEGGDLSLRLDYSNRDDYFIDVTNTPELEQSSYGLVNGRITYGLPDGKTTVAVWGKNLADKRYLVGGIENIQLFGSVYRFYGEPRMYGLTLTRSFF